MTVTWLQKINAASCGFCYVVSISYFFPLVTGIGDLHAKQCICKPKISCINVTILYRQASIHKSAHKYTCTHLSVIMISI